MSTFNEARELIYQRWATQWATTTDYAFPGENFTPPDASPWAHVTVRHGTASQETLGPPGARRWERGGSVIVRLYDVDNQGMASLDALAQTAKAVFEGVSLGDVRFQEAVLRDAGGSDGKWYQIVLEFPFKYEERR